MTFTVLSHYFQTIEKTASRLEMTRILADLFRRAGAEEIGKICYLLQGRVVPLYEALEFGIADKFIIRAIAQAYDLPLDSVTRLFKKTGDLGKTAEACAQQTNHKARKALSVETVFLRMTQAAYASGAGSQEKKIAFLSELLRDTDSLSARYIVRIPLDKLRLGFSDMTILDALSWMLTKDKSLRGRFENAYNVRPDIGYIAQAVKKNGIRSLSRVKAGIGVPILACLCQRLPNANEMIEKMGKVAVEPKYDGVRVQIHYWEKDGKTEVSSYSRNLENTTGMFPELTKIRGQLHATSVILDSEAVGMDPQTGRLIPFQETVTRKRKHGIVLAAASVPLVFFVFDILYKDGKDLLNNPLSVRRSILQQTVSKQAILVVSPQIVTDDPFTLRKYHDDKLKEGLEGVVVKKWDSPYEPGRRGFSWVKFKEEEGKTGKLTDTIDAVVMGFYRGEGKRAGFGIGAFLVGVRYSETFVTVTKVGTGVSDVLWHQLKEHLTTIQTKAMPRQYVNVNKTLIPDVWVEPSLVVELAGDDLTKSSTHGAGYAVRFPRLVRIRKDKSVNNVTTVAEIASMFRNQNSMYTSKTP